MRGCNGNLNEEIGSSRARSEDRIAAAARGIVEYSVGSDLIRFAASPLKLIELFRIPACHRLQSGVTPSGVRVTHRPPRTGGAGRSARGSRRARGRVVFLFFFAKTHTHQPQRVPPHDCVFVHLCILMIEFGVVD